MINYWLSQSKSIRKDLFNLFIGSYLLHGDYGKCTCWVANSSPPPAPKMSDFTSSLEEAHELLQIYFSRKWASPPENIYITKNPHGSSLMLVGSGVKGNSKTCLPSASLLLALRPAQRRVPAWGGSATQQCEVLEVQWHSRRGGRTAQWSLDKPTGAWASSSG